MQTQSDLKRNPQSTPISLELACARLVDFCSPRVVGRVNDQYIKVVKFLGEFPWHTHEHEDEMFLVLSGLLRIGRSDSDGGPVWVKSGEFFVVPRGLRHNTFAEEETALVLIETVTTLHTGSEQTPLTRSIAQQLG